MRLNHTCGFHNANPKVTSEFLAERYMNHFRDEPNLSLKYFRKLILRDIGVDVKYYKAYYARLMALYLIHGIATEQYNKVWDYATTIRKYNPGSSAFVMVTGIERPPIVFQRMYVCLQPCKEGFIQGCRHILGVDGCHLKGIWPGVCLVAVGKDGNNNLFPVAWAVVEVENTDSWTWFLDLLTNDLGSVTEDLTWVHENEELTFMSDRQKGLLEAFARVVPTVDVRYCVRHIWANFKLAFAGEAYRQSFWKAARASTKARFEEGMESIKLLSLDAFKYLDKIPPKHWSRHAFNPKSKYAMLLNNCCESFNNVLREARDKPILTMMEWIRQYVMKRAFEKRDGLRKFEGSIMPAAMKQLEVASNIAKHCFETISDVDLGNPEEYVHKAYSREAYLLAYSPVFQPMPGIKQWDRTLDPQPNPPGFKKMSGRPSKKKRTKEKGEEEAPKEPPVLRKRKPNECGNCGNYGHNKSTCKNPKAPPKPPAKRGRPPKNGGDQPESQNVRSSQAPPSSQH
ncbi:uncharacterized protein LOC130590461 [Beta vulgaris subsp. vulgaris]|uniref:uncharacterized protein LOC130590461 n=1 Tax=Beta vulgaris subsp. vulgaris TaxID=3555 RepID=UPI002548E1C5|nr:uncharacterized protein LOC130590461 [Beta vulgaris subsp. vulgaris]